MSPKEEPFEPDRSSSFGLVASAAVLALVLVAGIVVFATGGARKPDHGGNAGPSASAPAGGIVSDATGFGPPEVDVYGRRVDIPNNPAGQPLAQDPSLQHKPSDRNWLTAAPAGVSGPDGWQRVFGVSVPFSTSDGPVRLQNGLAVGYSHTPQGAVVAAAQISYRLNARPADKQLVQRQLRTAPDQLEAYDQAVDNGKLPDQQPEQVTKYLVAPDGFQVENYADDMAIVRLAMRGQVVGGQQTWAAVRLIVVWDAGDWRLKSSTSDIAQTQYIDSLVGWTQW
jgi:hypothetical protein